MYDTVFHGVLFDNKRGERLDGNKVMRRSPDLMLVLCVIVVLGVSVTAAVQAKAAESASMMEQSYFDRELVTFDAATSEQTKMVDWPVDEPTPWHGSMLGGPVTVNIQLGITYQGEAYDLSMGSARENNMLAGDDDSRGGFRYGFVGIAFGW